MDFFCWGGLGSWGQEILEGGSRPSGNHGGGVPFAVSGQKESRV